VDAITQERFREFVGRDPHPSGGRGGILRIRAPMATGLRFEWHPQKRKVYMIRPALPGQPEVGEIIAEHANTHGEAWNFVQTFMRGYREGQEPGVKTHLIG
jgi:hypothetical protein